MKFVKEKDVRESEEMQSQGTAVFEVDGTDLYYFRALRIC